MERCEQLLPEEVLARATLVGSEYAWPLTDIPMVIEAAKIANLLNIGGQLQFRGPEIGIWECYWVEVDTYKEIDPNLPWTERVSALGLSSRSKQRSRRQSQASRGMRCKEHTS